MLGGTITEVSDTLVTTEKGDRKWLKSKEGNEQKGTKDYVRGDSKATLLQRASITACRKAKDIRWAISSPGGISTMSQMSAFCVGRWGWG